MLPIRAKRQARVRKQEEETPMALRTANQESKFVKIGVNSRRISGLTSREGVRKGRIAIWNIRKRVWKGRKGPNTRSSPHYYCSSLDF